MARPEQDVAQEQDGVERPWELPGAVRRDVEPHRGRLLRVLGAAALVCGILALVLAVPGLIGLPVAVAVLVLSGRDLGRMRRGLLDPAGRAETEKARDFALWGLLLSVIWLFIWGLAVLSLLTDGQL
jgi:hypothetical protein